MYLILLFLFPFSLLGIDWSDPVALSNPMSNASSPLIVSDPNGNLVAAWIEDGAVKARACPTGSGWEEAATVANSGAAALQLAIDGSGNATAIWIENGNLAASTLPLGGNWEIETSLSLSGMASSPQIAVNAAGNCVAAWVDNGAILSKTKPAMGTWQIVADTLAAAGSSPAIAVNATKAAAAWQAVLSGTNTIYTSQKTIGSSWGAAAAVSSTLYQSGYPKIAIDAGGNILAIWYRYTPGGLAYYNVILQSAYQRANKSWQTPVDVSISGVRNPADLPATLAFNNSGVGLTLWSNSFDAATFTIQGAAFTKNDGWLSPITFITSNVNAYAGTFSLAPSGYAFAIFMMLDPNGDISIQGSQSYTYSSFNNFTPLEAISIDAINGSPQITSSYTGGVNRIAAAWLNFDGEHAIVQTASGTYTSPFPSPTNLSVIQSSQDNGIFTEYFNTFSWESVNDPSFAGISVYRNGQLVHSALPGNGSYVDHNQTENGTVIYGVAVLGQTGEQSPIATITWP